MRILVINLATDAARKAFQRAQMKALGLNWERLDAFTPRTAPIPTDDPHWQRWERPMRAAEIAIFASHCMAWERVDLANQPHLIVEDDVLLASEVPAFLRKLEDEVGVDHLTLEVRSRKKLVGISHPSLPIRRLYQDRTGAAAYVLWPSGARKLRSRASEKPGLADAVISAAYEMKSWQADPALAIQLDQCSAYGMTPPIVTESSVGRGPPPSPRSIHRIRRVAGQFRMVLRQISKLAVSERRQIILSPDWPVFQPPPDS